MKTLGLLGGMSWESTAIYYRLLNEIVRGRLGGLHSAKLLLWSFDFAEIAGRQHEGDWQGAGALLTEAACKLEAAGAEGLVICTNTMHKLADAVQAAVSIPLIHIADATAAAVRQAGVNRPVLLATRFTMEQDFYKGRLIEKYGLQPVVPDQAGRDMVHRVIYDELCQGIVSTESKAAYIDEIDRMRRDQRSTASSWVAPRSPCSSAIRISTFRCSTRRSFMPKRRSTSRSLETRFPKVPAAIWREGFPSLECPKFRNSRLRGDKMEFAFPWPMSQGEWLAWSSAVVTLLFGLLLFLAPVLAFRILRLQVKPEKTAAIAEGRGRMSGFYLGVGLCCILLAQPLLYMALGFSWLFTAFGRLLSMMSDSANTPFNWAFFVVELVLAALPLAFVFGFVA